MYFKKWDMGQVTRHTKGIQGDGSLVCKGLLNWVQSTVMPRYFRLAVMNLIISK